MLNLCGLTPDELDEIRHRCSPGDNFNNIFNSAKAFREKFKADNDGQEPASGMHSPLALPCYSTETDCFI